MKTLVKSKKVIIFQEQVGDGLFWDHQNFDTHAVQDSPISLLFLQQQSTELSLYSLGLPSTEKGYVVLQFLQKVELRAGEGALIHSGYILPGRRRAGSVSAGFLGTMTLSWHSLAASQVPVRPFPGTSVVLLCSSLLIPSSTHGFCEEFLGEGNGSEGQDLKARKDEPWAAAAVVAVCGQGANIGHKTTDLSRGN